MPQPPANAITRLLQASRSGDPEARARLADAVVGELRRIAAARLRRDQPVTSPTALVSEAYLRLTPQESVDWQSRSHVFGFAAHIMRQILVDRARNRHAQKRGGDQEHLTFNEEIFPAPDRSKDVLAVHQALERLIELDERQSRIVEMHFFAGMTVEEIAAALEIGTATVKRELSMAKAFLARTLRTG